MVRRCIVHGSLCRIHRESQWRPPRLGRQAQLALIRSALHVARAILFSDLQRLHQSIDPLLLPSLSHWHVFEEMVLVCLVRDYLHGPIHHCILHYAPGRLQTDQGILDGF